MRTRCGGILPEFLGSELSANFFSEMKTQIPLKRYQTELLTSPDGPTFEEAYAQCVMAHEKGIAIPVISYHDLFQKKRMLGCSQDIADVEALENGGKAV